MICNLLFWFPERVLSQLLRPVTKFLDNFEELEREYLEFWEAFDRV